MDLTLRDLVPEDWPRVATIYREGINTGDATFETEVPSWEAWDASRHACCRIVAVARDTVVGFAAVSPTSKREVYRGVAEVMIYVGDGFRGRGVGRVLLEALVRASEEAGIWTLQAGIFPENRASIALHEEMGFRILGVRRRLGQSRDGRWRDVVLMERRSAVAGTE